MSDQNVFDLLEQFKRDHPEYMRAIEITREYDKIMDAQKPKFITVTTRSTVDLYYCGKHQTVFEGKWCPLCGVR